MNVLTKQEIVVIDDIKAKFAELNGRLDEMRGYL